MQFKVMRNKLAGNPNIYETRIKNYLTLFLFHLFTVPSLDDLISNSKNTVSASVSRSVMNVSGHLL